MHLKNIKHDIVTRSEKRMNEHKNKPMAHKKKRRVSHKMLIQAEWRQYLKRAFYRFEQTKKGNQRNMK